MTDKKKVKSIFIYTVKWLPALAVMVTIFSLSHQPAVESAETSIGFLDFIEKLLHITFDHNVLREVAHGIEYFGLALCVGGGFFFTTGKPEYPLSAFMCLLFCIADEIHQIYVPGRAFQLFDIGIDSIGIACGISVWLIICLIIKRKKSACTTR